MRTTGAFAARAAVGALLLVLRLTLLAFRLGTLQALARTRQALAANRRTLLAIGIAGSAGTGRACIFLIEFQSGHHASGVSIITKNNIRRTAE